jgi:hypothetical protein
VALLRLWLLVVVPIAWFVLLFRYQLVGSLVKIHLGVMLHVVLNQRYALFWMHLQTFLSMRLASHEGQASHLSREHSISCILRSA